MPETVRKRHGAGLKEFIKKQKNDIDSWRVKKNAYICIVKQIVEKCPLGVHVFGIEIIGF
jgi:hypothetical protein